MKLNRILLALFILTFIGCSSRVERAKSKISLEQVDAEKLDPLASFESKKDSVSLFQYFKGYNFDLNEIQNSEPLKTEENRLYSVQVGLSDSFEEISSLKVNIQKLFPDKKVEINYEPPFYRILIGPFDSREKANEIFSILEKENYTPIKIRIDSAR